MILHIHNDETDKLVLTVLVIEFSETLAVFGNLCVVSMIIFILAIASKGAQSHSQAPICKKKFPWEHAP